MKLLEIIYLITFPTLMLGLFYIFLFITSPEMRSKQSYLFVIKGLVLIFLVTVLSTLPLTGSDISKGCSNLYEYGSWEHDIPIVFGHNDPITLNK